MAFSIYYSKPKEVPVDFAGTLEEIELAGQAFVLSAIRDYRNDLLAESDWTQNADVALTAQSKQNWANYRQSLRDFTNTVSFESDFKLTNLDFPTKPTE